MTKCIGQQGNLGVIQALPSELGDAAAFERQYWHHCQRRYNFQPIYRTSGKLLAIELLTAVFSPEFPQRFVSPETYFASINVAERLQVVIEQMQLLSRWHPRFIQDGILASVNVDGQTLHALQQSHEAKQLIASMPWLRFEIVENQGMLSQEVLTMFPEMRHLWLDDFGAGVANFSSLMQAQYDCINVARELFILLQKSDEGRQLFPSLVALLSRFCNHVVVEGGETQEEWGMVTQTRADAVQGYILSRPQTFENFSELKSTL